MSHEPSMVMKIIAAWLAAWVQLAAFVGLAWLVYVVATGDVIPDIVANASGITVFRLWMAATIPLTIANFIDLNRR